MPDCTKCGSYTKYYNGLCYSCYKKKNSKAGNVYIGESTRKDGSKKIYTGQTKRDVYKRVGEHIKETKKPYSKTYTGKGTGFKLIGSVRSKNRFKAEKTIKKLSPAGKKAVARKGARRFKKRRSSSW